MTEPRPRYHKDDDTNIGSNYGHGVMIDTYLPTRTQIKIHEFVQSIGGKHRPDVDETYCHNFLSYEFPSVEAATDAVRQINENFECDCCTFSLGQCDGTFGEDEFDYWEDLCP